VLTTALTLFGAAGNAHAGLAEPNVNTEPGGWCAHAACSHPTIVFTTTRDTPGATTPAALKAAAEIYLMSPETTDPNPRQLTKSTDGGAGFATLSPDGTRIVFDRLSSGPCGNKMYDNISNLYIMDADGRNQRELTRGSSATWSPDGKDIAFHASASYYSSNHQTTGCPINSNPGAATTDSDIFVANVDDLLAKVAPRNITNTTHVEDDADWSVPTAGAPDGRIVFTSHSENDNTDPLKIMVHNDAEVYVMNPDGSDRQPLTKNDEEERAAAWSPDGTRIVYSCRIGGFTNVFQICVMNADGTNIQQLTADDSVANLTATWSPDGQDIVFNKLLPHVPGGGATNYQLFTLIPSLKPDGSLPDAKEITCAPGQTPPYLYPCPSDVTPTAGINLLADWGVLRVKS
jgi:Tol biopolymer transport system component